MRKFLLYLLLLVPLLGYLSACQTGSVPIVKDKFDDPIKEQIIKAINESVEKIYVKMYGFTDEDIIEALKRMRHDVNVRVILDCEPDSALLTGFGAATLRVIRARQVPNKICIISNNLVITGRYNISENGHKNNYEDVVFLYDPDMIKKYQAQFEKLWQEVYPPGAL